MVLSKKVLNIGKYICVCITESLLYRRNSHNTVNKLYFNFNKEKKRKLLIFYPLKQKKKKERKQTEKSVVGSPTGSLDICVKYIRLWIPVTIPAS